MRVSELLTKSVPVISETETARSALAMLREATFAEYDHVYLTDDAGRMAGQVPIESLIKASPDTTISGLKGRSPIEVPTDAKAERVALEVIENKYADVAVLDSDRRLVGAVPINRLLTFLHKKHIENIFRHGGIGVRHHYLLDSPTVMQGVRSRLPWLILGLGGGILMGGIASVFERSLRVELSLSFFLPLVVYMSDAIGTQTETLTIRRMAARQLFFGKEIAQEATTGLIIGSIVGISSTLVLALWTGNFRVAVIVGLSVFSSAVTATIIASCLPWVVSVLKGDPAAASGPVATVIQDFLSVTIYLGIATLAL
jgi:magnesium transporter